MSGTTLPRVSALPLVSKPPVESFFDTAHAQALWPKSIAARADFCQQIKKQQILLRTVEAAFSSLPYGTSLTEGFAQNLVTESFVRHLLDCLTDYLQADLAYQRIIFYLPLEFTGPIKSHNAALNAASDRFQKIYRTTWEAQLQQHDVRANFVDGDVLEVEKRTGDLKRVVKAAHLIPGLINSGHLSFREVIAYAQSSSDELLKNGVIESCAVLLDMKLIDMSELGWLATTDDVVLIQGYDRLSQQTVSRPSAEIVSEEAVLARLSTEIAQAQLLTEPSATPNRLKWLRSVAVDQALLKAAKNLSSLFTDELALPDPITLDTNTLRAYVEAMRMDILANSQFTLRYRTWLDAVKQCTSDNTVHDTIAKLHRHTNTAGIRCVNTEKSHDIVVPALQGPFSKNLENFTPSVSEIFEMIESISHDVYLTSRIYPVTILLGSQLKGYGISSADADVAVFVKPGTAKTDCDEIAQRLQRVFAHDRIDGSALMFWLDKDGGTLVVTETTQTTGMPPLKTWVHVLMGGAWIGEEKYITHLQHNVLPPFLFNPTIVQDGKPVRERWLEEMERDSIQYRLLHKGYERYYTIHSPLDTSNGRAVDGQSALYDPMFRRIATVLFLTRVFLPNLD